MELSLPSHIQPIGVLPVRVLKITHLEAFVHIFPPNILVIQPILSAKSFDFVQEILKIGQRKNVGDIFYTNFFIAKFLVFFTPKFLLSYTKNFAFFTPIFLYTKNFAFFTPILLYTKF